MIVSIVELTTHTGISDEDLFCGDPEIEDVKNSKLYRELIEDCGGSQFILMSIRTFNVSLLETIFIKEGRYVIIPEDVLIFTQHEKFEQKEEKT